MWFFNPVDKFSKISAGFRSLIDNYSELVSACEEQVKESERKIKEQEAKKSEALSIKLKSENAISKLNEIIGE